MPTSPETSITLADNLIRFIRQDDKIRVGEMFGRLCGDDGGLSGRRQIDGLFLLSAASGRFEANDFALKSVDADRAMARFVWTTANGAFEIESVFAADAASGVVSRRDVVTNVGDQPSTVFRALPRLTLCCGDYEAYVQRSRWNNENQGDWVPLRAGSLTLQSQWGRSTEGATPYCCVRETGTRNGVVVHVIPEGNWILRLSARSYSNKLPWLVIEAGLSDEDLRIELKSGERLTLPEILIQDLPEGDPRLAAPRLHRYLLKRLPARANAAPPIIYNTWLDRLSDLDLPNLRAQLATANELGCETFVIDAGWYGQVPGGWGASVGDWREKLDGAFRGRMRDFADEVRAAGLAFGLWIEPERFGQKVPVVQEHPEWFVPSAGGQFRIDLSQAAAREYQYREISRLIETYDAKYLKLDFNLELGFDPSGGELSDYDRHWNATLDRLRERYPEVVFENCASGAMRLDIRTLFHYDIYFPSDTANPVDVIRISEGLIGRTLPGRVLRWAVLKGVTPLPCGPTVMPDTIVPLAACWRGYEGVPTDFALFAACFGVFGLSGDIAGLSEAAKKRTRWAVDFYKRRRCFLTGAIGRLLTPIEPIENRRGWSAFFFFDEMADVALVFVFRFNVDGQTRRRFPLFELDKDAEYEVSKLSPDGVDSVRVPGKTLTSTGLEVYLPYAQHIMYQAAIYEIVRTGKAVL